MVRVDDDGSDDDDINDGSMCSLLRTNVVLGNVLGILQKSFLIHATLEGRCH